MKKAPARRLTLHRKQESRLGLEAQAELQTAEQLAVRNIALTLCSRNVVRRIWRQSRIFRELDRRRYARNHVSKTTLGTVLGVVIANTVTRRHSRN